MFLKAPGKQKALVSLKDFLLRVQIIFNNLFYIFRLQIHNSSLHFLIPNISIYPLLLFQIYVLLLLLKYYGHTCIVIIYNLSITWSLTLYICYLYQSLITQHNGNNLSIHNYEHFQKILYLQNSFAEGNTIPGHMPTNYTSLPFLLGMFC